MSVTVRHLNGDSTFLLVFSPEPHPLPSDLLSANGAFSLLIDPWLSGPSVVTAPWFAKTTLRTPSAVSHLSEIEEPDVVVVSQNKPDHCHKDTLLQLRPEGKTVIAAEPGAAKAIKSWHHFDPNRVVGLSKFDSKVKFGRSLRLRIPPLSASGFPGEVCISFIPAKNYVTGLHNAFGITYQAPTHTKSVASIATIDLPKTTKYFHMPLSPMTLPPSSPPAPLSPLSTRPMSFSQPTVDRDFMRESRKSQALKSHRPQLSRSSNTASSEFLPITDQPILRAEAKPSQGEIIPRVLTIPDKSPCLDLPFHFELDAVPTFVRKLPTPPDSPEVSAALRQSTSTLGFSPLVPSAMSPLASAFSRPESLSTSSIQSPTHHKSLSTVSSCPTLHSPVTPARPKAISIIYSPHGLPLSDLQPYIETHLVRLAGALPLTILFHSFDHAQNPWYFGGNIMTGMDGGADIARALMARCWISAHDEEKDDRGLSVKRLRVKRITAKEVRRALWEGEEGEWLKKRGWTCDVRSLDVGTDMVVGPTRDLCAGMEGKRESRLMKFAQV